MHVEQEEQVGLSTHIIEGGELMLCFDEEVVCNARMGKVVTDSCKQPAINMFVGGIYGKESIRKHVHGSSLR